MSEKQETLRQRARREGNAFVRVLVDTKYARPKGARIEIEIGTLGASEADELLAFVMAMLIRAKPEVLAELREAALREAALRKAAKEP